MFVSPHRPLVTLVRRPFAGGLAAALLCALPALAQAPLLRVHDPLVGTLHTAPSEHSLKVGHALEYELVAPPGRIGLLAFGAPATGPAVLIGGDPLFLAPATILVALPGQLVPASGSLGFAAVMPSLPEGTSIHAQGATLDLTTMQIELSMDLRGKVTHKPFVTVAIGSKTAHPLGSMGPTQLVIQNAPAWQAFWAQHNAFTTAPPIDFGAWGVLVAFRGATPSFGYPIRVDQVALAGSSLAVTALHYAPLGGCATLPSEQRPFHFVAVPASTLAPVGTYTPVAVDSCN